MGVWPWLEGDVAVLCPSRSRKGKYYQPRGAAVSPCSCPARRIKLALLSCPGRGFPGYWLQIWGCFLGGICA